MYKLIPLNNHCVVEVDDFPLPIININEIPFVESNNIYDLDNAKRLMYPYYEGKTSTEVEFINIFQNEFIAKVLPLMRTHPLYNESILSSTADINLSLSPLISKDQIGWSQSRHTDLPRLLASGVIHITESIEGTEFYDTQLGLDPVYVAPTKPRTGAFWLNSPTSFHQVSKVTLERNHFLFLLSIMEKQ
jgi:hypothetical protein